ncbi:hypothetical protein INT45_001549 [Circinella minor]|uniref:Heterokaryon incompatibility domain-containing protein n=1 Tax=Circinella minor TaxID=1195481 RepID=A0A8H7RVM4_9FUNG|nr:hypothetical protein INT45_001549 [Circinella minor]
MEARHYLEKFQIKIFEDVVDRTNYRLNVTGGEHRPTWLVRVSDWQKVPGKEAVDGYHTISYCWEQSGEVVKNESDDGNEEYSLIDNGKHCIVEGYNVAEAYVIHSAELSESGESVDDQEDGESVDNQEDSENEGEEGNPHNNFENANSVNKEDNEDNNNKDNEEDSVQEGSKDDSDSDEQKELSYTDYVTWCVSTSESASKRYVTYDQLLQQVCKDFQIEYVWYDKVCIDQADNEAKSNEIKQMHKIYCNARYTVAMVSEALLYDLNHFEETVFFCGHKAQHYFLIDVFNSCWFKRSWTLEELMMARRILIVGTNTNMFQHSLHSTDIPTTTDTLSNILLDFGAAEHKKGSVNQALSFAHFRTSTKQHDMIYALKNTFSYMFDDMEVSYSAEIKLVFDDFYRHVATEDLSILCFGSNGTLDGTINLKSTMDKYNLPSWTGVAGRHTQNRVAITTGRELEYYIDDTMLMHVTTSRYWKISITPYEHGCYSLSKNSDEDPSDYLEKIDRVGSARYNDEWTDMDTADKDTVLVEWLLYMQNAVSSFMTHYHERAGGLLTHIRPLTLTEDCEECIILPILLESHTPMQDQPDDNVSNFVVVDYDRSYCLPVIRECTKGTGRYKSIGIYYLGDRDVSWQPSIGLNYYIGRQDINMDDPGEIINALFENDCHDVPKEFIIE